MNRFKFVIPLLALWIGYLSSNPLSAATVAHWRFESGGFLNDSGPNGYTLTPLLSGAPPTAAVLPASGNGSKFQGTLPQTGQNNSGAASFSTSGGFSSTHPSGNSQWHDLSFTIEAYFNLSDTTGIRSIAGQLGGGRRWLSTVSSGNLTLILNGTDGTDSSEAFYSAGIPGMRGLTANTDYYMAMSVDLTNPDPSNRVHFYLKNLTTGGPLLTASINTPLVNLSNSTAPFTIGSTANPSSPFAGLIDEVRLSDSVLSEHQLLIAPEPSRVWFAMMGLLWVWRSHRRR